MPVTYTPVFGRILTITISQEDCCQRTISVLTENGPVTLILSADTYVAGNMRLRVGMQIAAFYDGNLPVPLIFPPQYRAVIITAHRPGETVVIDFFDQNLLSDDASLQLNLGSTTDIITANGQPFSCPPGNHMLMVYYSSTTRSIPPQTTPRKIIVLC